MLHQSRNIFFKNVLLKAQHKDSRSVVYLRVYTKTWIVDMNSCVLFCDTDRKVYVEAVETNLPQGIFWNFAVVLRHQIIDRNEWNVESSNSSMYKL